ncbi:MAG: DUF5689 domain-containing protein [Alphaproteobacteria bacterium]|nr:DUF5689 domain-containing protein [Alphaproteobacteria bacterium]
MKTKIYPFFLMLLALQCSPFKLPDKIQLGNQFQPNTTLNKVLETYQFGKIQKINTSKIVLVTVVANDQENNFYKTIIVEDSTAGVYLNVDGSSLYNTFPIGSRWAINLEGLSLFDYNNNIQIGLGYDTINKRAIGIPIVLQNNYFSFVDTVTPQATQLTEASLNLSWQNRYIELQDVEFNYKDTGDFMADYINKFSINRILQFCTGTPLYVRTSGYANFASQKVPGANGTIKGILSVYNNDLQLILNKWTDVQLDKKRCGLENNYYLLNQSFENYPINSVFSGQDWYNLTEKGQEKFKVIQVDDNNVISISAYSNDSILEAWLVSPLLSIPQNLQTFLEFSTKCAFDNGAELNAYISEDFYGDINEAHWQRLSAQIARGVTGNFEKYFISSGEVRLSSFAGKDIRCAFKYSGVNSKNIQLNKTTTFLIDNIKVFTK